MENIKVLGIKIKYNAADVRILNPRKAKSEEFMKSVLKEFKFRTGFVSKRSINSWVREWKAHNRLYKLGLFKEHTIDCDLEENEKWYRLIAYLIIGSF